MPVSGVLVMRRNPSECEARGQRLAMQTRNAVRINTANGLARGSEAVFPKLWVIAGTGSIPEMNERLIA